MNYRLAQLARLDVRADFFCGDNLLFDEKTNADGWNIPVPAWNTADGRKECLQHQLPGNRWVLFPFQQC